MTTVFRCQILARGLVALLATPPLLSCLAEAPSVRGAASAAPPSFVTTVAQFRSLAPKDFLAGCDFRLTGTVTLVDTNRNWVVLQDETGAVALDFRAANCLLRAGQSVTFTGTNCSPFFSGFPDFPNHASGRIIQSSFEAPANWGQFNLTRMRGYLHPKVAGDYTFFIASDDSSELWLSSDSNPANVRKIASVPRYGWTEPHQWHKLPSQHSEPIHLNGGETYYIEALQEQALAGEHLSVAWQRPPPENPDISIIDGQYLTPWRTNGGSAVMAARGVLLECWTNYFRCSVEGMAGLRPYASALTFEQGAIASNGVGPMPPSKRLAFDQPLAPEDNYRWVTARGVITFKATEADSTVLELSDGKAIIEVRALCPGDERLKQPSTNATVQVEGACEGVIDPQGRIMPGRIWVSSPDGISLLAGAATNEFSASAIRREPANYSSPQAVGFFGTRGVVTFNDSVFGKDYTFIQEDNAVWLVAPSSRSATSQLKTGDYIDVGGAIDSAARPLQTIGPTFVSVLGFHSMPLPIAPAFNSSRQSAQEGMWAELEGVVRGINRAGTLSLFGEMGVTRLWVGQTTPGCLSNWVDAKLRVRGVFLRRLTDSPLLLIPSRDFIEVEEKAPKNPFAVPRTPVVELFSQRVDTIFSHRAHVTGAVTYFDAESCFVEDASGGMRVQLSPAPPQPLLRIGAAVDVCGFLSAEGSAFVLTEALVREAGSPLDVRPKDLDLSEPSLTRQDGCLVSVSATLLNQRCNAPLQILELQGQHGSFTATLSSNQGQLATIAPGSRVRITGVRGSENRTAPAGERFAKWQFPARVNLLLRRPDDVVVLSGPPWWTWKTTAALSGALLITLFVVLLWVYYLRRRLERQHKAQLAFSHYALGKLEEERRRIAANLHDSLGHMLLVIKNNAALAAGPASQSQGVQGRLSQISETTSQAIEEVRRIAHGLHPPQLQRLGLSEAIRALVDQAAENRSILFASRVENIDGLLGEESEIQVYRIVQEAITNVVKHSGATEATVVIKKRPGSLSLSIRDNGRGFDPNKPPPQSRHLGFGLTGIAERARILKGTMLIDSHPGAGTSLTVEVPSNH